MAQNQILLETFHEKKKDVTTVLGALAGLAEGLGAKSLKERIAKELVRKLEEDRFHLVIVGEFNHGKTTFVNALLGQEALAVGVTPTTAAIHHLKYAEVPEANVVYNDGRREPVAFDAVKRFAVGGGANADEVDYLEVGYPAPILRERILLVDTPGVNDLSLQRADITYSYIPRADAVLFLLDAGQILKESERVFLNEKLLKGSRDKIIFVITKWDLLSADEQKEALAYAREHLSKLVHAPVVFPVSAETALASKVAESGLPELLKHLTHFLAEERGRIMLDNALGEAAGVGVLLGKGLLARRRAVEMKSEEIDRRIQLIEQDLSGHAGTIEERRIKIKEEISGIKVGAKKDLDRFVDETVRKLPDVIDAAKPEDLRQYLPAFLEDAFKQWAEAETKEVTAQLETLAEKTVALVRDDAEDSMKRVAEVLGTEQKRLDVQIDTLPYDIGVVALMFGGLAMFFVNMMLGGLLLAAGPILALFMRGKVHEEFKRRAKELAPDVLREAARKVAPRLDEMIDGFGAKLDAWVVSAGEELHREVLEVLRAAKDARSAGAEDETAAKKAVDEQAAQLAKATARVEELRAALWAPREPQEKLRVAESAAAST